MARYPLHLPTARTSEGGAPLLGDGLTPMRARGGVARPRCGCEAGWKFRIVRKVVDLADMSIELGLLTQRTPDTTTNDYP